MSNMKVSILGTGYVGLVTAVGLANTGKEVNCLDIDEEKISLINRGISPIYEPGLDELLLKNKDKITAARSTDKILQESDVIIIAVGTPFDGFEIDLTQIIDASVEIGRALKESNRFHVVVVKSTVVPETTNTVVKKLVLENSGKKEGEIGFAMNPEFLREGNAVEDFMKPDRIVIGADGERTEKTLRTLYDGFEDTKIMITNPTTAETIKYTANSYLALTISFANEIARICETLSGVDSEEVFKGVILDKRISPLVQGKRIVPQLTSYLRAGIGFGGSCFPKDVLAFRSFAEKQDLDPLLLKSLLKVNESQLLHVYRNSIDRLGKKPSQISILGTAFKPGTDDIRESPGIKLAELALKEGVKVVVHDYIALENTREKFGDKIYYESDPLSALRGSDLIFLTTIWDQYLEFSDDEYENQMEPGSIFVDTRSHFKKRDQKKWRIRVGYNTS